MNKGRAKKEERENEKRKDIGQYTLHILTLHRGKLYGPNFWKTCKTCKTLSQHNDPSL